MCGQQHSFFTYEQMFSSECRSFRDRKCLELMGTRTPTFGFMLKPLELSKPHICCPVYLNTGDGFRDIFVEKFPFEMLTVRGQQHSSTHMYRPKHTYIYLYRYVFWKLKDRHSVHNNVLAVGHNETRHEIWLALQ